MTIRLFLSLLSLAPAALPALAAPETPASKPPPARAVAQVEGTPDRVVGGLGAAAAGYGHRGDSRRIVALARICVEADPGFTEAWSAGAWLLWSLGDTAGADAFLAEGA